MSGVDLRLHLRLGIDPDELPDDEYAERVAELRYLERRELMMQIYAIRAAMSDKKLNELIPEDMR